MRISISHKFIALANPRCASTSIRRMVDRYSEYKGQENCELKHHSALRTVEGFVRELGYSLDDFFIFTTVRNPWDRAVSIYHYGLKNPKSAWHKPAVESKNFKAFLFSDMMARHFRPKQNSKPLPEGTYDIDTFLRDRDGTLRGHVFRFEQLYTIEAALKDNIGLEVKLPHVNTTERESFRQYYDDEARRQVEHLFEGDIKRFQYRF